MKFQELLERLAEMFPRQDYHTRLENYIVSKRPSNINEVEYLAKRFEQHEHRGLSL